MFKFVAFFALLAVAAAAPGLITETHHVVQPVVTKTAYVDNSASSAITHQSFTNLERKVPVVHTVAAAPVVKTVSTPVVHTYAAPLVKTVSAPVVHTYAAAAPLVKTVAAPVVHTYAAAPVLKTVATPVVHTYAAAPVVHTAPLVKTVVAAPVAYTAFH
ncbi:cuticle protein LPCP-23-like [Musca vetustissima]|uniref:cuticle protein LPCP-23-like n=1 Tax=Musca vetustissima TaxID=27455 RepID=UPI002AB676F3|nr:cuticle protein LPCP-23-like [Musca vetustissima]